MQSSQAPKILYVEDDANSRKIVKRLLELKGYQVILASDGLSGIRLAQSEHPDLVLIDINMGGLDGHEVATRLRNTAGLENIPIVALTGNVLEGDRERALIAGCNGYIPKPFNPRKLADQIRAYLLGQRDQIPEEKRNEYLQEYNRKLVKRLESKVIELEQANQELQEANQRLLKLDTIKSDFIILAAHELRTPISVIHGYAHLLFTHDKHQALSSILSGFTDMIQSIFDSANQLDKIVNDLLHVSSAELGELQLYNTYVSIYEVVQSALSDLLPLSQERHLAIKVTDLEYLPLIQADWQQLQQVFWNLISNALKYTPDGGQIRIWGRVVNNGVEVVVQDTGIGINPEDQLHIFDRFFVVEDVLHHSSSKTSFMGGGLGLGLCIARAIVEAHHGRIWVESERRDEEHCPGSRFHVLLPVSTSVNNKSREAL